MKRRLSDKKWWVIISGLIITALPIIGLASFVDFKIADYIKNDVINENRHYAIIVSERIKDALDDEIRIGNLLVSRPHLGNAIKRTDRKEIERHLKDFIDNSITIDRAYITNSRGIMLADCPTDPSVLNMDVSHRDWYKGVSKKWLPYVSEFYLRTAKPRRYLFAIAIPIRAGDGGIIGVLVLQPKEDYLKSVLASVPAQYNQEIYVADKNGALIYHSKYAIDRAINISGFPAGQRVLKGRTGVGIFANPDGQRMFTAYRHIEEYGWGVVVERSEKEAFGPLKEVTFGLFAFASIMLLTGGYFAYKRSALIYSLQKFAEELETSVDKRTDELKVANAQLSREVEERREATELLLKSEKKLKDITSSLAEGIEVINEQGNIIFMNPEAEHLLGWTMTELMNKNAHNVFHYRKADGSSLSFEECNIHSVIKTAIPFISSDEVFIRKDGTNFPISAVTSPIMENGKVVAAVTAFRDITERKKIEMVLMEKTNLLNNVINSSQDYIFVKDSELRTILCNEIFANALGKRPADLYGKTDIENGWDPELVKGNPEKGIRGFEQDDVEALSGNTVHSSTDLGNVRGEIHCFDSIKVPLKDGKGNIFGMLGISRDVTRRKRMEEKLKETNDKLEAANKELEAFSYSVSHDLRAPLRHMSGFVKLLEKRLADHPDKKNRDYMVAIVQASKKMEMLIDDLLAFSRMGRADLQMRKVNFHALVIGTVREIRDQVKGRDIKWEIDDLPDIYGDQSMLKLVLVNLISNAVKYTSTRPRAEIRFGYKEEGGDIIFFVKDNGVGFDMKQVDRLFGVFQRLHTADEFEGTGIGLANVRRVVSRHGGRTWAEGSVGQGATFYFTLPKTNEIESP